MIPCVYISFNLSIFTWVFPVEIFPEVSDGFWRYRTDDSPSLHVSLWPVFEHPCHITHLLCSSSTLGPMAPRSCHDTHVALAPAALTWPRLGLDLSSNREDMKASQWRKGVSFGSQVFLISLPGQGLFNQFSYFLFLQHSVLLSMLPNYIFDHTERRFWCQTAWIEFSSNGNTLWGPWVNSLIALCLSPFICKIKLINYFIS